eukprot:2377206-Alexandrium_andersonii.AAC.1
MCIRDQTLYSAGGSGPGGFLKLAAKYNCLICPTLFATSAEGAGNEGLRKRWALPAMERQE